MKCKMPTCGPIEKIGDEDPRQSSTGPEAEQTLVGDAFPDSSTLPECAATRMCTTHPFNDLDGARLTPPVLSRPISHNLTPRPHLFPSLEAARDHVYRKSSDTRQASRNAYGNISQTPSEDEPSLEDMNPLPSTRAFGHSLTSHAQLQSPALPALPSATPVRGFTPITKPVIWDNVPKPLNTSSSRNASSSQMSGSSVDNIIAQYGQQSSSAAQSQVAVYGGLSSAVEMDHLSGQDQDAVQANASMEPCWANAATEALAGRGFGLRIKASDQSVPPGPPNLKAPLHPSNPFFSDPHSPTTEEDDAPDPWSMLCPADPDALLRETPTPPIEHASAKLGSDPGVGSITGSETVSIAESKVGPLHRPSNAMHSVRRQQRGRQGSASYNTHSAGAFSEATDASGAEEDPFKYDRGGLFLQPSRERVVSANLRKVGGLLRESTATVYSQDGTPSRTFYGEAAEDYFDMNRQPILPVQNRPQGDLATPQALSRNPFSGSQNGLCNPANVTRGFYDPDAINPEWASDSRDMVRVPVTKKENLFDGSQRNPRVGSLWQPEQEVGLEALRRREGDNRITGNTED